MVYPLSIHMPPLWGWEEGHLACYRHVAPLGLRLFGVSPFYKHVAPLGLIL